MVQRRLSGFESLRVGAYDALNPKKETPSRRKQFGGNQMNTTQAVARILKTEGVEWVACFPSNQLIEVVAKEGIRPIMFRHERGAIMAADGYSRLSRRRKFGVVITQDGPGAENSMGGIAQAFADNVPILHLPGGPGLDQYAIRPNFSPFRTYQSVSK